MVQCRLQSGAGHQQHRHCHSQPTVPDSGPPCPGFAGGGGGSDRGRYQSYVGLLLLTGEIGQQELAALRGLARGLPQPAAPHATADPLLR